MSLEAKIEELIQAYLEDGKFFIVSIRTKPTRASLTISILLDSDTGITIQECASISRRLAHEMEALELIETAYNLEVSSPGLDQPLVLERQYQKNIGRTLAVQLTSGDKLEGVLTAIEGGQITLELPKPKKKSKVPLNDEDFIKVIALENIAKALVKISFK